METNYIFPLPVPVHIAFCIIGFIFFMLQYYRKKYTFHLLLAFAIPSTLLIYACRTDTAFAILGFEELILFIIILVSIAINKKRISKLESEAQKHQEEISEDKDEDSNT